jgi:molybdopterin converting factor small subunit
VPVHVRILAFARAREALGSAERTLDLPDGALVRDAWARLRAVSPALAELEATLRVARNGTLAAAEDALADGDELALLPPVGGG